MEQAARTTAQNQTGVGKKSAAGIRVAKLRRVEVGKKAEARMTVATIIADSIEELKNQNRMKVGHYYLEVTEQAALELTGQDPFQKAHH